MKSPYKTLNRCGSTVGKWRKEEPDSILKRPPEVRLEEHGNEFCASNWWPRGFYSSEMIVMDRTCFDLDTSPDMKTAREDAVWEFNQRCRNLFPWKYKPEKETFTQRQVLSGRGR